MPIQATSRMPPSTRAPTQPRSFMPIAISSPKKHTPAPSPLHTETWPGASPAQAFILSGSPPVGGYGRSSPLIVYAQPASLPAFAGYGAKAGASP